MHCGKLLRSRRTQTGDGTLISFAGHKEASRLLRNAVLDDATPASKGDVFEYHQGETDFDPRGDRRKLFNDVYGLYNKGRVMLYQVRLGDDFFSYRAKVV